MSPRRMVILLALVGIGLLCSPAYMGDVRGDMYYFSVYQTEPPTEGDIQSYNDLPPEAQAAFDEARDGDTVKLYEHPDRRAIEALPASDYVRVDGTYYRLSLRSEVNDSTLGEFFNQYLASPLLLVGGFLVGLAIVRARDRDWQPDTPRRVGGVIALAWLWSVVGAIVSIFLVTGQLFPDQYVQTFVSYAGAFTIALVPLLTGSALRRRNWPIVGATALPVLALGVLSMIGTVFLLAFIVVLFIGVPALGAGYRLAEPTA